MRIPLLQAFVQMMPALQAREAMAEANVIAYGSGRVKKEDGSRMWRSWERLARRNEQRPPRQAPEQMAAMFESMGIQVEHVKVAQE